MIGAAGLFVAKLAAVAAVVLGSSMLARRVGHAAGGLLAGLPMIAGPITGLMLIDIDAGVVRGVCLATLACQPALVLYLLVYAHAARRLPPAGSLAVAAAVFVAGGIAMLQAPLAEWARVALAIAAPPLALRAMPALSGAPARAVAQPRGELAIRVGVAVLIAAGVMGGAQHLGPGPAGLLLATPITGVVLPLFTQARHGGDATAALLGGFLRGQVGFVAFFLVMLAALPAWPGGIAWPVGMIVAAMAAQAARRVWRP